MEFPAVPRQVEDGAMSDDSIDFEGIEWQSMDWCGGIAQTF